MNNKHSLTDFVFNKLREDILNGRYQENDELKELNIAKELNVSRTPVREAIKQLEFEGLVESIPNKATYVRGISLKDVRDIYEMRASLEGLCVKMVIENLTEEKLARLEEITELSAFYYGRGKYENMLELDNQFHCFLYEASESKMLKNTLTDFHHYLERIRHTTLSEKERAGHAIEEHKSIVEAIRNKNVERAEELSEEHIINSMKNMIRLGLLPQENIIDKL